MFGRAVSSVSVGLNPPGVPTRLFGTYEEALSWIRSNAAIHLHDYQPARAQPAHDFENAVGVLNIDLVRVGALLEFHDTRLKV